MSGFTVKYTIKHSNQSTEVYWSESRAEVEMYAARIRPLFEKTHDIEIIDKENNCSV